MQLTWLKPPWPVAKNNVGRQSPAGIIKVAPGAR